MSFSKSTPETIVSLYRRSNSRDTLKRRFVVFGGVAEDFSTMEAAKYPVSTSTAEDTSSGRRGGEDDRSDREIWENCRTAGRREKA